MDHAWRCPPGAAAEDGPSRCPRCGSPGSAVDLLTVKALLTEVALRELSAAHYCFCAGASCDVVYFGGGQTFTQAHVRVPVWQKQPFGSRMLCYCFDENETSIRGEIEAHGTSPAAERIRQHINAGRCACGIRNPRGLCCLGDVLAALKRIAAASPATGD